MGWGYPGGFAVIAVGNVAGVGAKGGKGWGVFLYFGVLCV